MTRKDYIAIAEAMRYARGHAMAAQDRYDIGQQLSGVMAAAEYVANAFASDNPRFDREHFLAVVRGEREPTSRPPRKRSAQ